MMIDIYKYYNMQPNIGFYSRLVYFIIFCCFEYCIILLFLCFYIGKIIYTRFYHLAH